MQLAVLSLSCLAMAACGNFDAHEIANSLPQPGEIVGPPAPPATVAGVDVIEIVVLALAALGLGPVARILIAAKPVLTPILRVLLGKAATPKDTHTSPTPRHDV